MAFEQQELPGISDDLTFTHPIFNEEPAEKPRSGPLPGQMVMPPAHPMWARGLREGDVGTATVNKYGNVAPQTPPLGPDGRRPYGQTDSYVLPNEYNLFGPQFDKHNGIKQVWDDHAQTVALKPETLLDTAQNGLRNPPLIRSGTFPPDESGRSLSDVTEEDFRQGNVPLPAVIHSAGRLVPVDGHHRLERQRQLGMDPLVRLLDVDHPMTRAHINMARYGAYDKTGESYGPPYV